MTRDKAKYIISKLVWSIRYATEEELTYHVDVIDEIYNDFESRTCENCMHFIPSGWCGSEFIKNMIGKHPDTNKDFGCNKWVSR